MQDVDAAKRALRADVTERLAGLAPARRALEEEIVQAAIQETQEWANARTVLLYKGKGKEFSVVGLTLAAWRAGKATVFPRVAPDGLHLHRVFSWGDVRKGALGIEEPSAMASEIDPKDVALAIVPGLAWQRDGFRLGRGGGYFDRLIPRLGGPAWGVGFDCQIVENVPKAAWDVAVARVWSSSIIQESM